jgi:hypothetical protein
VKLFSTIFLVLLIGIQTFSGIFIVLGFELNRDFIAKNLCINRRNAIPCGGTCYLRKQLNQDQSQQSPGKMTMKEKLAVEFLIESDPGSDFTIGKSVIIHSSLYIEASLADRSILLFQPPRV